MNKPRRSFNKTRESPKRSTIKQSTLFSHFKMEKNNTLESKYNDETTCKTDLRTEEPSAKRKLVKIVGDSSQRKFPKLNNDSPKIPGHRPSLADNVQIKFNYEDELEDELVSLIDKYSKENVNVDQSHNLLRASQVGNLKSISLGKCTSVDKDISDSNVAALSTPETIVHPSSTFRVSADTSDKPVTLSNDSDRSLPLPKGNVTSTEKADASTERESQEQIDNLLDDFFEEQWLSDIEIDFSNFQRCKVANIEYEANGITLDVRQKTGKCGLVLVRGSWVNCIVRKDDTVAIRAEKKQEKWMVDDLSGMLVVHPDTLLSGTTVSGATFCARKSVLAEKFQRMDSLPCQDQNSAPMVIGTLVHELLQTAINKDVCSIVEITGLMEEILQTADTVVLLYATNITFRECREKMSTYIPKIKEFILHYLKDQDQSEITSIKENFKGKVMEVRDIEETIWSPELGIKGKIDITAQVKIHSKKQIMPLEIKTGRVSFSHEHRGQVILYLMMMALTEQDTDTGLLVYLKENHVREIKCRRPEERDLIILRNTLAHYLTPNRLDLSKELDKLQLPEPINSSWCSSCEYNTLCCAYLSRDETLQLSESHALKRVANQILKTYKPEHIDYVLRWISLLQMEESVHYSEATLKHLWTLTPEQREKNKRAVCNLKMLDCRVTNGRYVHSFARASSTEKIPYMEFNDNEYVIISTNARINLAAGFIDERSEDQISVTVARNLTNYKREIFHVNKYGFNSLVTNNLSNVGGLMFDNAICNKLRETVIEKKAATFDENSPFIDQIDTTRLMQRLNEDQLAVIRKAVSANDYLLIRGMPGTGKTETVIGLIMSLQKMKLSVLITAHTNSAVDNILLKLLGMGVDFLRLGSTVHPSLIAKTDAHVTSHCTSPESLEAVYSSKDIVGTTCHGANHPLFRRRTFDYCVVDESTQALQPTILRPLYSARKFILVGDPDQLPPIVRNMRAKKLGADESLFSRLDNENNTISLTLQYRMNRRIMYVANKFTYKDKLKCGDVRVADACIATRESILANEKKWVQKALSPLIGDSVILIDTGSTCSLEKPSVISDRFPDSDETCSNVWEAVITAKLVRTLLTMAISAGSIGVISPYRAQVELLGRVVKCDEIEINTVDQYQGRDKDIIIYSCSKSLLNADRIDEDSEILGDRRRLNVAITRARKKLIIIADKYSTSRYSNFDDLYKIIEGNDNGDDSIIHLTDLADEEQLIHIL